MILRILIMMMYFIVLLSHNSFVAVLVESFRVM